MRPRGAHASMGDSLWEHKIIDSLLYNLYNVLSTV
jgi:hypothetical protein